MHFENFFLKAMRDNRAVSPDIPPKIVPMLADWMT